MALATLQAIETKVRRLTRSPSESQLSQQDLDNYINNFILYDFPEHLRLFSLRKILTFYTQPNVDTYSTNTTDPNDPLYNFQNQYIAVHPPVYIAGVQAYYTQWRDQFYGYYPQTNTVAQTGLFGDGLTTTFSGSVVASPMLQNSVMFNAVDINGTSMIMVDYPYNNVIGALDIPQPTTPGYVAGGAPFPYGQINYITGAFSIVFPKEPGANQPINVENITYQPGLPVAMLYYNNEFILRPVPIQAYTVNIEVDIRPTQLILETDVPQIEQWWQFIALGAARKIFQDRFDFDSVNLLENEYRTQMNLVNRTSLVQNANERTVTIYTQGKTGAGFGWFGSQWPY